MSQFFNMNQTTTQMVDPEIPTCSASVTDSKILKATKTILLTTIMAVALMGNLFIIFIVYKKKIMRRTTNIFIANMAASDLFIAIVVIPKLLTELYVGPERWLVGGGLGTTLCKFCFFLADFSVSISIVSHAVIAIDRFWAIVYSLRPSPITPARRKYIIAGIWLFSFLLHSPNLYSFRLRKRDGINFCGINWSPLDNKTSQKTFYAVIFVLEFCVPTLLMTFLYSWLIKSLVSQRSLSAQSLHMRKKRRKEDIRVLRKVMTLLIVFLICLIPITVYALLFYYYWNWKLPCSAWGYSFAVHFIFLSNSAVNPCLCIALSESYKHYIQKHLCRKGTKS
jgi:hypothetical protein